ncbi:MAG TPA: hypothetical protein DEH15_02005 [Marinilabiliales bacterium]|jgi:hypothetical protein|nr:hypothetical protein [Marinilabiliales bacterium]
MINLLDIFVYLLNQQLIKNVCSSARKFLFFWGGQFGPAAGGQDHPVEGGQLSPARGDFLCQLFHVMP